LYTICGTDVNSDAQNLPSFSDNQPKSKVPQSAPSASKLPTHEAWSELNGSLSGDSDELKMGRNGEAHPMEAPTPSAIMFTVHHSRILVKLIVSHCITYHL
jgi:hypothetical protein